MEKKILLLINPKARSGEGVYEDISAALTKAGHHVVPLSEELRKEDFNLLIRRFHTYVDLVILGGGDGSINYVLSSLVETKVPFMVYPLGTANLLARSFDLKADISELTNLLEEGEEHYIDVGSVNDIYFINVCGLGLSTQVNSTVSQKLKKFTGPLAFWITGLMKCRSLQPFKLKISVDGNPAVSTRTWQVTICNGRRYAAWMKIKEDASYSDEKLHCLSTEVSSLWEGFKILPSYFKGEYKVSQEVTLFSGREISIHSKKPLAIDVDGDVKTKTPALFKVHPKSLRIIIPPELSLQEESVI